MKRSDIRYPLLFPAAGLLTVYICLHYGDALADILFPGSVTLWPGVLIRLPAAILLCVLFCRLTDIRPESFAGQNAASVWKHASPMLLMMFLLSSAETAEFIAGGAGIVPDRLTRLPAAAVFCLLVGLTEELAFRALPYESFRMRLSDDKRAYRYTAVMTFLLFGAAHIFGEPLSADPLCFAALLLRFTETGLFGLIMLRLYAGSGGIIACSAVHAVFDLIALLPSLLFSETVNASGSARYDAVAVIILAAVSVFLFFLLLRLRTKMTSELRA
ncbi:MAG: CPBP family intramembrane metalloprotease [Clostridia bacterium]|nr:CPBP family intramembrane metalloprotease [Clostridia bacterium]